MGEDRLVDEGLEELAKKVRSAVSVVTPPMDPLAAARLAEIAGANSHRVTPGFLAWAIALSGIGTATLVALAYLLPIAWQYPGRLLILIPSMNLLLSPIAALALVERRRQHAT